VATRPTAAAVPDRPGARATISRSLDLALRTAGQLRSASIYIGLQFMAILGPAVILVAVALTRLPEFASILEAAGTPGAPQPATLSESDGALFGLIAVEFILAGLGVIALSLEAELIAMALLAGQLVGRPLTLHEALARSRQSYWRVFGASLLVGVPLGIVAIVAQAAFGSFLGEGTEATVLASSAVSTILSLPFVYIVAGVLLGEVGAVESVRRSMRLARSRWRAAFVVALFAAAVGYIQLFAFGAGGDILVRIGTTVGLGFESGSPTTFVTISLILVGLMALGSLVVTISALTTAPEVVAFVALTGYTAGLDLARETPAGATDQVPAPLPSTPAPAPAWGPPPPSPRGHRWVSIPMAVGIALGVLASVAGIANIVGRV
jgi:hypothetical protein